MKNIFYVRKIVTIFSICICQFFFTQANYFNYYFPEPPKAPSSSAFLKYGDIQNSEYTGTNSPSINLFNLQSGDIKLPVNLNYISGNGIRVTDEAQQVGLGWDLGFPTIVQNVQGYDDFSNNIRYRLDFAKSSLPFANNFPLANGPTNFNDIPGFNTYGYYLATNNNVPRNGIYSNLVSNFSSVDMQPDIFVMNLFGEKIEFIISNFTNYDANSHSSISFLSLNKDGYKISKSDLGFTIKDPKGFTYKFNNIENIGEYVNGNLTKATGRNFHITEIIDRNGNKISFEYISTNVITNPTVYSWVLNYTTHINQNFCTQGSSGNLDFYSVNDPQPVPNPNRFGALNTFTNNVLDNASQQKYLYPSKITANEGKLIFDYSDRVDFGTKKLDKITLLSMNDTFIDDCQFNYDYFLSQAVPISNIIKIAASQLPFNSDRNKRLKLVSLKKGNEEEYSFSYNETLLPPKDSFAVDYWGYPNGGINNQSIHLYPADFNYNVQIPINDINNNKKIPDINFTKSGILEKIIYPTRGYSKFIYELNEASNLFYQYNNYKYTFGNGLRLKEHLNYDNNSQLLSKTTFEYEGGKTPNPINIIRQDNGEYFFEIGDCAGRPVIKTIQGSYVAMSSSSTSSTFALSSGNKVGYSRVIKKQVGNAITNGRTEINYSNSEDIHFGITNYNRPIFLPSVKGSKIDNGTVLKKVIYNSINTKLKEEKFDYIVKNSAFSYGVTMIHPMYYSYVVDQFSGYSQSYRSAVGYYPIYSTETLLNNIESTDFVNSDSLKTKTDISYTYYNLIKSKSINFPDGRYKIENIKYALDKNNTKLVSENILNIPLETEIIGNVINGTSKRTSLIETKFDNPTHLNPTSVISYNLNDATPSTEVTYDLYNSGKLLQYTTKNGIANTIIWGYNNTQIIAKIEGGSYSQIMQAFGLDPNNPTSYLELEIVKKSNLDVDDSSENILITKLDEFKNRSEFNGLKISTYTYDPFIGLKSITNDFGLRNFYKYNPQNKRLEKIIDSEDHIIKEFQYKYAPKKFYNSIKRDNFTRNNCGPDFIGGSYEYIVAQDTYSSYLSQQDADQMAQNDISANGQAMANIYGNCTQMICSLTMLIPGGGGISTVNQNHHIQFGFSSGVGRPWTTEGVIIGKINGDCIPQTERTSSAYSGGFLWSILIKINGDIVVKKIEGLGATGVPDNTSYNLDFVFPIN